MEVRLVELNRTELTLRQDYVRLESEKSDLETMLNESQSSLNTSRSEVTNLMKNRQIEKQQRIEWVPIKLSAWLFLLIYDWKYEYIWKKSYIKYFI